jgi:hypothetical protein
MAVYDDLIAISKNYLGPAAAKFVDRQIIGHLGIDSSQLTSSHMEDLAKWCYISGKLLMDEAEAKEYSEKIKGLK